MERLEERKLLSVSVLNNSGNGYSALSFNSSGGYVPPDTCGAAGPSAYVETVNQTVALYGTKATGGNAHTASLNSFFTTTGGLTRTDSISGWSDPIVTYDEKIGRFIIGDQDVDFSTHLSNFDVAVSTSNNPADLTAANWKFYKINTTESGYDADYPGNFGYNADAFVFVLNMFVVSSGTYHVQIVSVNANDLMNGVASPGIAHNDLTDFSVRPTTMHDSVPGDPMWLVTEHGDDQSIDVIKMTNVLTNGGASFAYTNLAVTPYQAINNPLNPNGTTITSNIDTRIMKAAEANNTIVATHAVAPVGSTTQDAVQWYAIIVAGGTPVLSQQGRISAGNNTYLTYPGIDINSSGSIGMSYIGQGTDTSTDYMSMYVTGRVSTDAAGTMETPVLVPAGTGQTNYTDFASTHREGDLSGINVDPVDGTFWAANEFANTQATANWGTAVADFSPSAPTNSADMAVTVSGPSSVTAGTNVTYAVTITNNGPSAAAGVVLADTLPNGSVFGSMTQTGGTDAFTLGTTSSSATETANGSIAAGSSDTFSLVVSAPSTLQGGANFSDSGTVSATTADPNSANNTATQSGTIATPPADVAVANSGPGTANEGDTFSYTVTVTNNNTSYPNGATGVVLTDTLGANLKYVSAVASQGTPSLSGSVVTLNVGGLAYNATPVTMTITVQATEGGALTNSASVTSTTTDPVSSNNSAATNTVVAEPAIVVSAPIVTSQRSSSNIVVATFTHANGVEPTSAFKATINWGDGKTSTGTITLSGTTYTVRGSHNYQHSGSHKIATTVVETGADANLLAAKVGDETSPDLPARWNGWHSLDNGQMDQFAAAIDAYFAASAAGQSSSTGGNDVANSAAELAVLLSQGPDQA